MFLSKKLFLFDAELSLTIEYLHNRIKNRDQNFILDIDRKAYLLVRSDDPPNRLSDEEQTIRAEVVDHDELLAEPSFKRGHRKSRPFPEFS